MFSLFDIVFNCVNLICFYWSFKTFSQLDDDEDQAKEESDGDASDEVKSKLYKPPKLVSTHYGIIIGKSTIFSIMKHIAFVLFCYLF